MTLLIYLAVCLFILFATITCYTINEVKERQKLFDILILIEVILISVLLLLAIGLK